jgi:FixJ family two-component response regulator
MEFALNLVLVDSDTRRRAAIAHELATGNIHVEPFESILELTRSWPHAGIVLLHDEDGALARLTDAMAHHGEWLPVVAFSEEPDAARIVEAVLDGAIEYIAWPLAGNGLAAALNRALGRAERLGNARLRQAMARARIDKLTRRECQVLDAITRGLSNRLIGERLAISARTVEIHRANMLKKLGASHTCEAIRIAIEADIDD